MSVETFTSGTQKLQQHQNHHLLKLPDLWFKNVLKDVTLSFIANNPWMLYSKAPHDPELTPSVGTYGQGNDYFMQPSVRSFGFGIKFKL